MDQSDGSATDSVLEWVTRDRRRWAFLILLATVSIIAIPPALNFAFPIVGLDTASIIISGLLSLILVILYFQQYRLLDRQTSLMEREYSSTVARRGQIFADGDAIYLSLRNTGRGTVRTILLRSEVVDDIEAVENSAGYYQLRTVNGDRRSLPGHSDIEHFEGQVRIGSYNNQGEEMHERFEHFSSDLARAGIGKFTVRLTLEIVDETDQAYESPEEFQIAEQEVELESRKQPASESEPGKSEESVHFLPTEFSEGLPEIFPQDVMPRNNPLIPLPEKFQNESDS